MFNLNINLLDSDDSLSLLLANVFDGIAIDVPSIITVLLIVVLLLISGFVAVAEEAFSSLSAADLRNLDESGDFSSDKKIVKLLDTPKRLLMTVLITGAFVNVSVVVLGCLFFANAFGCDSFLIPFLVLTIALTVLLLLTRILFKIYFSGKTLAYCRCSASIFCFLENLFYPLSSMLLHMVGFFDKRFVKKNQTVSADELSHALELTDKAEISEENDILEGVIRFGGETVKEVMTARLDMVDLDIRTPFRKVIQCVVENSYSRIPVYSGSRDDIKGILYIKDLFPYIQRGDSFRWQSLIRPAYFVPETKMIDDLLRDLQVNKVHIAIVVDEFGGTSGLITMEDIIEEIVGEIHDEYDEEERTYTVLGENVWVFEAKTLLTDFYKITKVDEGEFEKVVGEADTLAGMLLEIKGEFPALHEKVSYRNYEFEVLEMDNRRILKVKFTINPVKERDDEEKED